MADKKLFELQEGTPSDTDLIAYGKSGSSYKNITVANFKADLLSGGGNLKTRVYEMTGGWDMTYLSFYSIPLLDEPVPPIIFGENIAPERVRSVSVIVRNDAGTLWYDMSTQRGGSTGSVPLYSMGYTNWIFTTWNMLTIQIDNGGFFDSADFNNAGISRGFVTITYD